MDYKELIDKLVRELSYRVGIPNVKDKTHQSIMSEILSEWGEFDTKQRIFEFLTEAEPEKTPEDGEYKNTGGSGYVKAQDYDKWKENPKGEFQKFSKTPSGKYIPKAEDGDEEEEKKTGGVFDTPEMKEKIEAEEELLTKINKNELKEIDLKNTLNEASFLDPKYKPGHQIIVATPPPFAKELKKGDVLTIVTDKSGEPDYGDGGYEKTLQFPNGTEFKVASKNTGYASSYFTHLKSGKAMPAGEDWESLIIVAFNEIYEGSEWDRAEKFWADYGDDARKVAESFKKLIKSKSLSQLGSSTAALNSDWGGSNKTPKTDILGNSDERISLKKSGGSQLMSGGPEEALATFDAAIKTVGENKPKILDSFLNTLEDKMGKMTQKGTITALQKLRDSGETLTKDQETAIAEMNQLQLNAQEIN